MGVSKVSRPVGGMCILHKRWRKLHTHMQRQGPCKKNGGRRSVAGRRPASWAAPTLLPRKTTSPLPQALPLLSFLCRLSVYYPTPRQIKPPPSGLYRSCDVLPLALLQQQRHRHRRSPPVPLDPASVPPPSLGPNKIAKKTRERSPTPHTRLDTSASSSVRILYVRAYRSRDYTTPLLP